jgi:hypothetical protein
MPEMSPDKIKNGAIKRGKTGRETLPSRLRGGNV